MRSVPVSLISKIQHFPPTFLLELASNPQFVEEFPLKVRQKVWTLNRQSFLTSSTPHLITLLSSLSSTYQPCLLFSTLRFGGDVYSFPTSLTKKRKEDEMVDEMVVGDGEMVDEMVELVDGPHALSLILSLIYTFLTSSPTMKSSSNEEEEEEEEDERDVVKSVCSSPFFPSLLIHLLKHIKVSSILSYFH